MKVIYKLVGLVMLLVLLRIIWVLVRTPNFYRPADYNLETVSNKIIDTTEQLYHSTNKVPDVKEFKNINYIKLVKEEPQKIYFNYISPNLPKTCDASLYKGTGDNQCAFLYRVTGEHSYEIVYKSQNVKDSVYVISTTLTDKDKLIRTMVCDNEMRECRSFTKLSDIVPYEELKIQITKPEFWKTLLWGKLNF